MKSKNKISKAKLKIQLTLWACRIAFYLAFLGITMFYAWLIDRVVQSVIILGCYTALRWCYPTTWHAKTTLQCFAYSIMIFVLCDTLSLPLGVSIVSSVVISLVMTYILYKVQRLIDKGLAELDTKEYIYSLSEEELRNFAKSKGLGEQIVDTLVLKVIHNYRWFEICQERKYSKTGMDYHKKIIHQKLKVKL